MSVKLEDVPSIKGERFPKRISVALSEDAYKNLGVIKTVIKKDPSELMRMLLDDFLTEHLDKIKTAG